MKSRISNKARLASQSMDKLAASITNRNNKSVELTTRSSPSISDDFVREYLLDNPEFLKNNVKLFKKLGLTAQTAPQIANLIEYRVANLIEQVELSNDVKDKLIDTLAANRNTLDKFFSFNEKLVQQGSRENLIECVASESYNIFGLQGLLITPRCSDELSAFLQTFLATSWGKFGRFWGKYDRLMTVMNEFGITQLPIAGPSIVIQVWFDQAGEPGLLLFVSDDENHFAEEENYLFDYLSHTAQICGKLFDRYII